MFAVGLTTCVRAVDYRKKSVALIERAGFNVRKWSFDGVPESEFDDYAPRLGPKPTFKKCLASLLRYETIWLVVFQDDILVARGLRDWLERNIPAEGVVSLYTASPHDGPDGWRQLDMTPTEANPEPWRRSLGACAIAMPREVAELYLENDPQFHRTDRIGSSLGQFCHQQGLPFWVHNPSLVQHIGEVSCRDGIPMTDDRRAKRFCADVAELA